MGHFTTLLSTYKNFFGSDRLVISTYWSSPRSIIRSEEQSTTVMQWPYSEFRGMYRRSESRCSDVKNKMWFWVINICMLEWTDCGEINSLNRGDSDSFENEVKNRALPVNDPHNNSMNGRTRKPSREASCRSLMTHCDVARRILHSWRLNPIVPKSSWDDA